MGQSRLAYTQPERVLDEFVSRGMVVLSPDALGVPRALHDAIYARETAAFRARETISTTLIPDVLSVLDAPGLVAVLDALAGPDWAIVPFTHNAPFVSGAFDQHWHKDDNGPFNARWPRHHQAVQLEMLYFPQAVSEEMGPTAVIPYSQYWTFNHETNQDNFAGADHLDFNYQLIGMETVPVSGHRSRNAEADIVARRTEHDVRMHDAVAGTGWPLVTPFEVAPLEAGSVVVYSHNLFHRGNHRRDPFERWRAHPRFMWRFWVYRTTDPAGEAAGWLPPAADRLTGVALEALPDGLAETWRQQHHWLHTGSPAPVRDDPAPVAHLAQGLADLGDAREPDRIGAAYRLATHVDREASLAVLSRALHDERESLRRAATFGLIAMGDAATDTFLKACASPRKWLRKAGLHGLGDGARLTEAVGATVTALLANDASVHVRATAAHAIGCLVRRACARELGVEHLPALLAALLASLAVEKNRLGMDKAQGRSIKFVRPVDDCDVCEGIGMDYGQPRFEPVRSAVRENALVALVIVATHGQRLAPHERTQLADSLADIVSCDANVFAAGLALDALTRLTGKAGSELLDEARATMPIFCRESLLRAQAHANQRS